MKPNLIVLTVVVLTIGAGVYIAHNIDNSIGGINDYCRTNHLGFVGEINCTVWNKYYAGDKRLLHGNYEVVEYCDQHNVTGWRSMKELGVTGFATLGGFDCQAIRNFDVVTVEELFV
jgi:hypothetical protein